MPARSRIVVAAVAFVLALAATPAPAGIVVFEDGPKKLEVGGRIQIQYQSVEPDCPLPGGCVVDTSLEPTLSTTDDLAFRRLRPYVAGSVTEDWFGKIEVEFGEAAGSDEVQIKDAFLTWSGLGRGTKLTIGNAKPLFSREFLTSSARLQMIERSFVGDHNFGAPDRALGLRVDGKRGGVLGKDGSLTWGGSLGVASHDPDAYRLDLDTPANEQADWNDGPLVTARIDLHPRGEVKFEQADFDRSPFRWAVGVSAYRWTNDGDNDSYIDPDTGTTVPQAGPELRADLDTAAGLEAGVALRCHGFSTDLAWQRVDAETVDPVFDGGLYVDGESELDVLAVTAGYLVVGDRVEVAAAWDSLDADGYADPFRRTTVGLNWYLDRHDLKLQANYQIVRNFLGLADQDQNLFLAMMQFVF
jgi:hypothetical protein